MNAPDEADVLAEMFARGGDTRTVRVARPLPTPPAPAGSRWRAPLTLLAVLVLGAGFLFGGIALATALTALIWPAGDGDPPLIEALYAVAIFVPMTIAAVIGGRLTGVRALAGGRDKGRMIALGAAMGCAGVLLATGYAVIAGTASFGSQASVGAALAVGLVLIFVQSGSEEVLLRGWLQPVLARDWGPWPAVLVSAAVFAGLHLIGGGRSPVTLLNLLLGGVLFGLLALHGRGLAGPVAAHFGWNAIEGLVLGLDPNPGVGSYGAILDVDLGGAAMWGGSDEGLNASLAMTIVLVALVVPLALRVKRVKI